MSSNATMVARFTHQLRSTGTRVYRISLLDPNVPLSTQVGGTSLATLSGAYNKQGDVEIMRAPDG